MNTEPLSNRFRELNFFKIKLRPIETKNFSVKIL